MRFTLLLLCCLGGLTAIAQPTIGLVSHHSFDGLNNLDVSGNNNDGLPTMSAYECGASGEAVRFSATGGDGFFLASNQINDVFGTSNFSIGFYFKTLAGATPTSQVILSHRDSCTLDQSFTVKYRSNTRTLSVNLYESAAVVNSISHVMPLDACWQQVFIVRDGKKTILFVNGIRVATSNTAATRVDLTNPTEPLRVGIPACLTDGVGFDGLLDELLIYQRALSIDEIAGIYVAPDRIGNGVQLDLEIPKDTLLYLGNSFETFVPNTCYSDFQWSPTDGVSDPTSAMTNIEPTETTTYYLSVGDGFGCTTTDSIRVMVVDPDILDCVALLPNAFTPDGDGLNDDFGISNPFAVQGEFTSFEIFDRWGSRVFFSDVPFERWDGSFGGKILNPGVFLYKVIYACDGVEEIKAGSVSIIR